MLVKLRAALEPGDAVPVTLRFLNAGSITVEFKVQRGAAPASADHGAHEATAP